MACFTFVEMEHNMNEQDSIAENLKEIHHRIESACQKANRSTQDVKLLMATKTVSPERIRMAVACGEHLIGENKVQEYDQKFEATKDLDVERHFIGHLQTNKVKDVLKYVSCIESVDRLSLIEKLDSRLQQEGRSIDIFMEVNTSGEESKSGTNPTEAIALLKTIQKYDTLTIKGLMTIGMPSEEEQIVRSCFQTLQKIKSEGQQLGLLPAICEMSMGMSHDLDWAIQEGSTIVRVGSAIFGKRDYSSK